MNTPMIEPLHEAQAPSALVAEARGNLSAQLDRAIAGKLEILKFWSMVTVLQEDAERGVYSQLENKPPLSVPSRQKSLGGRPAQPTDLKVIFAACGIAESKWKTAYRLHSDGAAMAEHYEAQVGKRFASAHPLPALMNTPAADLPEDARKKQQLFFDFVATEHFALREKSDGRGNNPGGFRPSLVELRGWLTKYYPSAVEELLALVVNGSFTNLPEDVQAAFKETGKRYAERMTQDERAELQHGEDGRAWCEQIADALNLGVDKHYFHFATEEQWQAMQTAHTDLGVAFAAWAKARVSANPTKALATSKA